MKKPFLLGAWFFLLVACATAPERVPAADTGESIDANRALGIETDAVVSADAIVDAAVAGPDAAPPVKNDPSAPVQAKPTPRPAPPNTFPVKDRDPSNPFGHVKAPSMGGTKIIGAYNAGCIAGADTLPKSGPGFEVVRLRRNRMHGDSSLTNLLKRAGLARAKKAVAKPPAKAPGPKSPLILGDLAQPRGGPMTSGHTSHQLGIDVDIWFYTLAPGSKMTDELRESIEFGTMLGPDFKILDPKKLNKEYEDQRLWFAAQPEVDRIFVNVAIKKKLCLALPGDIRLKKLRPWYGHDDHYHVRLSCPDNQAACVSQSPIEGIDCEDSKLAYWYQPWIIDNLKNPKPGGARVVNMPLECQKVLQEQAKVPAKPKPRPRPKVK